MPNAAIYGASKAALLAVMRVAAAEWAERKIRVNAISPGPIDTPGMEGLAKSEEEVQQMKAGFAASVPLGRVGTADEIAKAAVFLASDDSSFVTGIELFVDGGMAQI